jgi:hypothetical protein
MPSQRALQLTNSSETVTKALAEKPTRPVASLAKGLFKNVKGTVEVGKEESELDKAARCGKFPERPSDLFLKVCAMFEPQVESQSMNAARAAP